MMYRVVGWKLLQQFPQCDLSEITDQQATHTIVPIAQELKSVFTVPLDPSAQTVILEAQDITQTIRRAEVSLITSQIAKFDQVRQCLVDWQREIIAENSHIVAEGRDITTVVAPDADLRILLVADSQIRQQRRDLETTTEAKGVTENVAKRDQSDNQVNALFRPAQGVISLDNSELTLEQTVDQIVGYLQVESKESVTEWARSQAQADGNTSAQEIGSAKVGTDD
jgi:GTP-binding protein